MNANEDSLTTFSNIVEKLELFYEEKMKIEVEKLKIHFEKEMTGFMETQQTNLTPTCCCNNNDNKGNFDKAKKKYIPCLPKKNKVK